MLRKLAVVLALPCALACRKSEPAPSIVLAVGAQPSERIEFSPRSAFAEYIELPGVKNELRITLASYEASCDRFIAPGEGEASVTVVVVTPPGVVPNKGGFAHGGEPASDAGLTAAYAAPSVRLGNKSHLLPPGGSIELERVDLALHGRVEGRLAFEFAGSAEHAATVARGAFSARVCRSKRAAP